MALSPRLETPARGSSPEHVVGRGGGCVRTGRMRTGCRACQAQRGFRGLLIGRLQGSLSVLGQAEEGGGVAGNNGDGLGLAGSLDRGCCPGGGDRFGGTAAAGMRRKRLVAMMV